LFHKVEIDKGEQSNAGILLLCCVWVFSIVKKHGVIRH